MQGCKIHRHCVVGMEFIIESGKKEKFEEDVQNSNCNLVVEMIFQIIANKNVATRCKCRSYLKSELIEGNVVWKSKKPMVFYYGNFIVRDYEVAGDVK